MARREEADEGVDLYGNGENPFASGRSYISRGQGAVQEDF